MPALKNAKYERFVTEYINGKIAGLSQGVIYLRCGFNAKTERSAHVMASRLLQRPDIQGRIAELAAPAARKAKINAEVLIDMLEKIHDGATVDKQFGPATRAVEIMGKLSGDLIERHQIDATFAFEELTTVDDLAAAVLAELETVDQARALFAVLLDAIERKAAAAAIEVADTAPTRLRKRNKSDVRSNGYGH